MLKDLKNNLKVVPSILPVAATGDQTGSVVALAGYESCVVTLTATTASVDGTFKLTECATSGGAYTDVAAADIIGTQDVSVVEDGTVSLGYIGNLGFIKAVFTHVADGVVSADAVLGCPHVSPTGAN